MILGGKPSEMTSYDYSKEDLKEAFRLAGIQKGDIIYCHVGMGNIGIPKEQLEGKTKFDVIYGALSEVVGYQGTILTPTYTYSFCNGEIYDPEETASCVGYFGENLRKLQGAKRSMDPLFSSAGIGPKVEELFANLPNESFGKDCLFDRLGNIEAKLCNIGVDLFFTTANHFVQAMIGVPYRFPKLFSGYVRLDGKMVKQNWTYYVRTLDDYSKPRFDQMQPEAVKKGICKIVPVGRGNIVSISMKDMYEHYASRLRKDPWDCSSGPPPDSDKNMKIKKIDKEMYELVKRLFPICRSITGNGVRETLKIIQEYIPIEIHEVPTGTKVFDWTVPREWNIKDAYVMDENGDKIIDFKKHNLHIMGYSVPVNTTVTLSELQEHLYSLPEQPEAIPYATSYYKERWGFCIAHKHREQLKEGKYKVFIDSELKKGSLTYGEFIIPGESEKEVFLSTYVCHPSMANNELSGPAVTTFLAKWILNKQRKYTYRIIFIPETIGSIAYLSKNLDRMKKNIIAGFNISCVGDNLTYSYIPTRDGNTYADKIALNVLSYKHPNFTKYSFLDKGSDERQYNSPGVDIPVCSVMRSKYGAYPEYHTSLDNLNFVNPEGLAGAYDVLKECLLLIEENRKYKINCLGEPQLGRRDLYPTISIKSSNGEVTNMMNFIAYADGKNDLIDISNKINVPVWEIYPIIEKLKKTDLIDIN